MYLKKDTLSAYKVKEDILDTVTGLLLTTEQQFGLYSLRLKATKLKKTDLINLILAERSSVYLLQSFIKETIRQDLEAYRDAIMDEETYYEDEEE